jgi:hypothetical protein
MAKIKRGHAGQRFSVSAKNSFSTTLESCPLGIIRVIDGTKVGVLIDVLLQSGKRDAEQKLEHMRKFALVAVASVGKLHWKFWGEKLRNHG